MEYYSALKRKDIRTFAAIEMNLECLMLSEISPLQKKVNTAFHVFDIHTEVNFIKHKEA